MKKCKESKSDIQTPPKSTPPDRANPIHSKTPSPGEFLFGRQLSTTLPSRAEPLRQHLEIRDQLYNRLSTSSNNVLQPLYPHYTSEFAMRRSTKHGYQAPSLTNCHNPVVHCPDRKWITAMMEQTTSKQIVPLTSEGSKDSVQTAEERDSPKKVTPEKRDSPRKVTFKLPEITRREMKDIAAAKPPEAIPSKKPPRTVMKSR